MDERRTGGRFRWTGERGLTKRVGFSEGLCICVKDHSRFNNTNRRPFYTWVCAIIKQTNTEKERGKRKRKDALIYETLLCNIVGMVMRFFFIGQRRGKEHLATQRSQLKCSRGNPNFCWVTSRRDKDVSVFLLDYFVLFLNIKCFTF